MYTSCFARLLLQTSTLYVDSVRYCSLCLWVLLSLCTGTVLSLCLRLLCSLCVRVLRSLCTGTVLSQRQLSMCNVSSTCTGTDVLSLCARVQTSSLYVHRYRYCWLASYVNGYMYCSLCARVWVMLSMCTGMGNAGWLLMCTGIRVLLSLCAALYVCSKCSLCVWVQLPLCTGTGTALYVPGFGYCSLCVRVRVLLFMCTGTGTAPYVPGYGYCSLCVRVRVLLFMCTGTVLSLCTGTGTGRWHLPRHLVSTGLSCVCCVLCKWTCAYVCRYCWMASAKAPRFHRPVLCVL